MKKYFAHEKRTAKFATSLLHLLLFLHSSSAPPNSKLWLSGASTFLHVCLPFQILTPPLEQHNYDLSKLKVDSSLCYIL